MTCLSPLTAHRPSGGGPLLFGRAPRDVSAKELSDFTLDGVVFRPVDLACGQCIGCRIDRSSMWVTRMVHEASMHEDNCFVTLTYSDEFLPSDGSLVYRDFQLFMKRLRKRLRGAKVRFFMCGEYGEQLSRPHYHACLFGADFSDRTLHSVRDGVRLYTSEELTSDWKLGHATVGDFNDQTAGYCSRYVLKKITGDAALEHYVDPLTGVVRVPEFCRCSVRPGIGANWFAKYEDDVLSRGSVVRDGVSLPVPRYYKKLALRPTVAVTSSHPASRLEVELRALAREESQDRWLSKRDQSDRSRERLAVKRVVLQARLNSLKRSFESGDS